MTRHSPQFHQDVILYAEDDGGFAELLQNCLERGGFHHKLIHLSDGEQTIAYLRGDGKYADRLQYPLPSVALLDLKMPRVNGFEVLKWIRHESSFPFLPVVVLTVSEEIRDVNQAYKLGANSFLTKPPKVVEIKEMLAMLDGFWVKHNVGSDRPHIDGSSSQTGAQPENRP